MSNVIVASAGTTAVNGTYTLNGTVNGRSAYVFGSYAIEWDGADWHLFDSGFTYYTSPSDVAQPWLATWFRASGSIPTPTFTEQSAGVNLAGTVAGTSTASVAVSVTKNLLAPVNGTSTATVAGYSNEATVYVPRDEGIF